MLYVNNVFPTILGSLNAYIASLSLEGKLSDFIEKIFSCVRKKNECLTGVKRHKGE